MKNRKFLAIAILLVFALVCVFALAACEETPEGDEHKCESQCPTCHKCSNKNCQEDACKDKCQGHGQQGGSDTLLEYDMSQVTFADDEVTYDGNAHTLTVAGTLPEGVTVAYEHYQGRNKLESAPVNAGSYTVVAKFTGDDKHKEIDDKSANLTINKATYDMSGVTLSDKSDAIYNGSAQTLAVAGTLPQGVTVAYEYYQGETKLEAAPVNVGTYKVVAKFTGNANYNDIADLSANLTIGKATYDMSQVTFADKLDAIYNGSAQTIEVDESKLPAGVEVSYKCYIVVDEDETEVTGAIGAGQYKIVAKFAGDAANYNAIDDMTAKLVIGKATYDMSGVELADKGDAVYNGNAQTISVDESKLPNGVTVAYEYYHGEEVNSDAKLDAAPVNAGVYTVVAKFAGDAANYNAINDMSAKLTINKANVDFEIVLGATKNANGDPLYRYSDGAGTGLEPLDKIIFTEKNGVVEAYVGNSAHGLLYVTSYTIEVLNSNVDCELVCYDDSSKVGSADHLDAGRISTVNDTVYVLVNFQNYNSVQKTVKGAYRVVEMDSYEDLRIMDADIDIYPVDVRLVTKYVLTDDIDLEGHVWQTIGTRLFLSDIYIFNYNFVSEFDGQSHTIKNLTFTEESVKEEYINDQAGIAFGFFGFVTDARVHDVTFDTVNADIDVTKLADYSKYGDHAYHWSYTNRYLYFGVVAGRVNTSQRGMDNSMYNITVKNLTANMVFPYGYIGTFFGYDGGNYPNDTVRSYLVAENINITGIEPLYMVMSVYNWGTGDYMYLGGFVGSMNAIYGLTYDHCSINGLVLNLERNIEGVDMLVGTIDGLVPEMVAYFGFIGAYVGYHSNADRTHYAEANACVDKFTNCSLTNFQIKNKSYNPNLDSGLFYRGNEYAPEGYSRIVVDETTCTREVSPSNYYYWYRAGDGGINKWWCDYGNPDNAYNWGNHGVVD